MPKKPTPKPAVAKSTGTVVRFDDLPDAEKQRMFESYNREVPKSEMRSMTPAERRAWARTQADLQAGHTPPATVRRGRPRGRPVIGKGAKAVQVTIEGALLRAADAYADAHKLNRSQLIAAGLRLVIANGITADTLNT